MHVGAKLGQNGRNPRPVGLELVPTMPSLHVHGHNTQPQIGLASNYHVSKSYGRKA